MNVTINEVVKGQQYAVNGKDVYLDSEGNWIAREELTSEENRAFRESRGRGFTNLKTENNGR